MNFVKKINFESVDQTQLNTLIQQIESRDDTQLQEAIQFAEQHPNYQELIEARYLPFIKARKKNTSATLAMFNEADVALSETEVNDILSLPNDFLGIDEGGNALLFYAIVDFAGAMIATYIDYTQYKLHQIEYSTKNNDLDYSNSENAILNKIYKNRPSYRTGWYGQVFEKLLNLELESFRFNHADGAPLNKSLVWDEFMFFASMVIAPIDEPMFWDFFQSSGFTFPQSIHLVTTSVTINIVDSEVKLPKPPEGCEDYIEFHEDSESRLSSF